MSGFLLAGALLALLLALAHGIGGHLTNLRRLWDGRAGEEEKLELGAVWHLYTWQLALTAALLAGQLSGRIPSSAGLSAYVAATFGGGALVIVAYAARRGAGALLRHPQWIFLGLLAVLAWNAR